MIFNHIPNHKFPILPFEYILIKKHWIELKERHLMHLIYITYYNNIQSCCKQMKRVHCSSTYEVHMISFQTFFVWAFKIIVDSWKFSMLLLYILWDDWPIFRISGSNEQLQQQLECTLLKSDCYSWWISKMQSGREDTLEEWYAIKFCFKLGKNAREMYGMLQTAFWPSCMNRASVFEWHKRFKEGRESVSMMRGVGGVRKSIHQSWLAKGLGLLYWGFKGIQEEIPREEARTL